MEFPRTEKNFYVHVRRFPPVTGQTVYSARTNSTLVTDFGSKSEAPTSRGVYRPEGPTLTDGESEQEDTGQRSRKLLSGLSGQIGRCADAVHKTERQTKWKGRSKKEKEEQQELR